MTIERRVTTEYPVRYEAFKTQKILFEAQDTALVHPKKVDNSNTSGNGGREFAVYSNTFKLGSFGKHYGVYGQIVSYQGIDYLVDIHAYKPKPTKPWEEQDSVVQRVPTYEKALELMLTEIPKLERWVAS